MKVFYRILIFFGVIIILINCFILFKLMKKASIDTDEFVNVISDEKIISSMDGDVNTNSGVDGVDGLFEDSIDLVKHYSEQDISDFLIGSKFSDNVNEISCNFYEDFVEIETYDKMQKYRKKYSVRKINNDYELTFDEYTYRIYQENNQIILIVNDSNIILHEEA